jgi:HEAT repeat protein
VEQVHESFQNNDVKALLALLAADSCEARLEAAGALGALRHPDAVPGLVEAMGDEEVAVRWAAAKALAHIGQVAIPALAATLQGQGGRLSPYALWSLGEIGSPEAVDALSDAVRSPLWEVRWSAATSLGDVGGGQASRALVEALSDRDNRVRKAAVEALQKIGEPAVEPLGEVLYHPDRDVCEAARAALVAIGSPAAQAILRRKQLSVWIPVLGMAVGVLLVLLWLGSLLVR